jgi:hypothetical protein
MLLVSMVVAARAQPTPVTDLYSLPGGIVTRWATAENPRGERGQGGLENAGRKGRAFVSMPAGKQQVLAEVTGTSGVVRRIWLTVVDRSPQMLRSLRIDVYWDGASSPAVSAPLGDFFGIGLGRTAAFESALFSNPEGRSFNCFVPMPFRTGMKIVVTNEGKTDLRLLFYEVDYTLGDRHGADMLYFHAHFRRERPTTLQKDYSVLPPVEGKGRFLGANFGVIADRERYGTSWWGEGELKAYVDGDGGNPTLNGTGSEDYAGTGWGLGTFGHLYQGCTIADKSSMSYCFYRYHVPDPIYFHHDIRVTIQQIGHWGDTELPGHRTDPLYRAGPGRVEIRGPVKGYFERQDDWSSCAYFYLDRAENRLPPLCSVGERVAGL